MSKSWLKSQETIAKELNAKLIRTIMENPFEKPISENVREKERDFDWFESEGKRVLE